PRPVQPAGGHAEPRHQHHVRRPRDLRDRAPEVRGARDPLPQAHPELTSCRADEPGLVPVAGQAGSPSALAPVSATSPSVQAVAPKARVEPHAAEPERARGRAGWKTRQRAETVDSRRAGELPREGAGRAYRPAATPAGSLK